MEDSKFSVGEVVTLKSGGPAMTVRKIEAVQDGEAKYCEIHVDWFHNHDPLQGIFIDGQLKKYNVTEEFGEFFNK